MSSVLGVVFIAVASSSSSVFAEKTQDTQPQVLTLSGVLVYVKACTCSTKLAHSAIEPVWLAGDLQEKVRAHKIVTNLSGYRPSSAIESQVSVRAVRVTSRSSSSLVNVLLRTNELCEV